MTGFNPCNMNNCIKNGHGGVFCREVLIYFSLRNREAEQMLLTLSFKRAEPVERQYDV